MELLVFVKELLELEEDTYDRKLTHAIRLVSLEVMSYTGVRCIPEELNTLIVEVVTQEHLLLTNPTRLKSLKEGEVSYEFQLEKIRSRVMEFKHVLDNYTTL